MPKQWFSSQDTFAQAIRFGVVGLKSNLIYYALYVILSLSHIRPDLAVTIVCAFGIVYAFWFNKAFVFQSTGHSKARFLKYTAIYVSTWGLNVFLLDVATIALGLNKYFIQAALILPIAALNFILLKLIAFRPVRQETSSEIMV